MSRRTTGSIFIAVSALLFAVRYLTAAIWGIGLSSWNATLFQNMLEYIGPDLGRAGIFVFALGMFYLIWGEVLDLRGG